MNTIDKDTFVARLVAILARGCNRELPRKQADLAIILKAITLDMRPDVAYTQIAVNDIIQRWQTDVAKALLTDHVTLRRLLVDGGFMIREQGGATYRLAERPRGGVDFAADVATVDVRKIVTEVREAVAARRELYKEKARGEKG